MWYFKYTSTVLLYSVLHCCILFSSSVECHSVFSDSPLMKCVFTDRATKYQPEVSAGSMESIQAGFRRDQWLPNGGKVLCVSFSTPHRLPGGCSAAGAKSAGMLG